MDDWDESYGGGGGIDMDDESMEDVDEDGDLQECETGVELITPSQSQKRKSTRKDDLDMDDFSVYSTANREVEWDGYESIASSDSESDDDDDNNCGKKERIYKPWEIEPIADYSPGPGMSHFYDEFMEHDEDPSFCKDKAKLVITKTNSPCSAVPWTGELALLKRISGYVIRYYTQTGKDWNVLHMELLTELENKITKKDDLMMVWIRWTNEHVKEILPYLDTENGSGGGAGTWIHVNNVEYVSYNNQHTQDLESFFKLQVGYKVECFVEICPMASQCTNDNSTGFERMAVQTPYFGGWVRDLFENSGYRSSFKGISHIPMIHQIRDYHMNANANLTERTAQLVSDLFTSAKRNQRCSIQGWIHYASPCLVDPITQQMVMFLSLFTATKKSKSSSSSGGNIHYYSINVILRNASVSSIRDIQHRLTPGQAVLLYGIRCVYNNKDGYVIDSSSGQYYDDPYELLTSLWLLEGEQEQFRFQFKDGDGNGEPEIPNYTSPYFHSLSQSPFHSENEIFMNTVVQSYQDKFIYSDFVELWKQISSLDYSPGQKFQAFIRVPSLRFHFEINHTNPHNCKAPIIGLHCGYRAEGLTSSGYSCTSTVKLRLVQMQGNDSPIQLAYVCKKGHFIQHQGIAPNIHQQQQNFHLLNARVELCDENKETMKCYVRSSPIQEFFSGNLGDRDNTADQPFITDIKRVHQVIHGMDRETQNNFYQDFLKISTRQEFIQILFHSTPGVVEYLIESINNAYYSSPSIVRVSIELPKNHSKRFNSFSEQRSSMIMTILSIKNMEI